MSKREEWIRQTKKVVQNSPKTNKPGFKPEIYLIGIEPQPISSKSRQEAEEYVCELEQKGISFDKLNIRVVVCFVQNSTNRIMVRHADIKNGELSNYFWPPHEDFGDTPLIYDDGKCKRPVGLP